ncbi:hypothetical protein LUZ63_012741 [Rhynchospora breviuscula]|uniref:Retrotransposon gag domain-containing protein n=1 Tax=Rhynchospora breviuscula TaxID=2022672 RepID=A0A9Q0HS92_9POAL|nr:hypothetical protein LUZ63_012741 [Rhynchospora breviuscula]
MAERIKPLREFAIPALGNMKSSIEAPDIAANNFELKPALLNMVQQNQFGVLPQEDPNLHLSIFLERSNTFKPNGVQNDAIRLRLFPFSLRDKARAWLHSLPDGSIKTWDQLDFRKRFSPNTSSEQNGLT